MKHVASVESKRTLAMRELKHRIEEESLRARTIFAQRIDARADLLWKEAENAAYFERLDLASQLYEQSADCYSNAGYHEHALHAYWNAGVACQLSKDSWNEARMFGSCAQSYMTLLQARRTRGEITDIELYVYELATAAVCTELRSHLRRHLGEHIMENIPRLSELSPDERREMFLKGLVTILVVGKVAEESALESVLEPYMAFEEDPERFCRLVSYDLGKDFFWSFFSVPAKVAYQGVVWAGDKVISGFSWLFSRPLKPALIVCGREDDIEQIKTESISRGFTVRVLKGFTSSQVVRLEVEGFIGFVGHAAPPSALLYVSGHDSIEGDHAHLAENYERLLDRED